MLQNFSSAKRSGCTAVSATEFGPYFCSRRRTSSLERPPGSAAGSELGGPTGAVCDAGRFSSTSAGGIGAAVVQTLRTGSEDIARCIVCWLHGRGTSCYAAGLSRRENGTRRVGGRSHFQLRISGRSWPCRSMYCLCSISFILHVLLQIGAPSP